MSDCPRILEVLTKAWDTTGGQSLRALMWSLHNDRVAVPMWSVMTDLDSGLRAEFAGLLVLELDPRGKAVERLLIESGEWDRIDNHPLRWEVAA